MKKQHLRLWLLLLILTTVSEAQDLNFKTTAPIYPDGALSNSYTGIGNPAVDVTVTVSSNGSQTFNLATPKPVSNGLQIAAYYHDKSDSKTITIEFSQGVSNLSFSIYGVDKNATGQDQVTIFADKYGTAVTPTITPSAFASVSGNVLLGVADETSGSTPSPVQFGDYVKKLTIVFSSGAASASTPGSVGITIGNLNWTSPLPVTLLSFTANPEGDRVQLAWATTSEQNADHFLIERSYDLGEYIAVGEVAAKGTTDTRQYYGLTDLNPKPGINYYRLKQIDRDGTTQSFKPVEAIIRTDEPVVSVYPNPTNSNRIHLRLWNADDATVQLRSMTGQQITGRLERQAGEADLVFEQPLPSGLYWLEVHVNGQRRVIRVLVP
ncbi:T9SS type A sorting domain-containing protein [Spirosoma litoris]